MPQKYRDLPKGFWPKGVSNRNAALKWIYQHVMSEGGGNSGALYFADDDNTYDIRLFEEVRNVLTCVCLQRSNVLNFRFDTQKEFQCFQWVSCLIYLYLLPFWIREADFMDFMKVGLEIVPIQ